VNGDPRSTAHTSSLPICRGKLSGVSHWVPPDHQLTDGRVVLRLPAPSDVPVLHKYASEDGGLEGGWLPLAPAATLAVCQELIDDWLAAWRNSETFHGPALAVVEVGGSDLIGQIGLGDRGDGVVELVYGIARIALFFSGQTRHMMNSMKR
jgi:hypothetical protein